MARDCQSKNIQKKAATTYYPASMLHYHIMYRFNEFFKDINWKGQKFGEFDKTTCRR